MSPDPRVTVLMPAYDRERYIGSAIESVLAQTYGRFELLVVDDGSSDRTAQVAESYRDSRIRVVRNERNLGIPAARNRGIAEARAEYIAMLDSDDLAEPQRLEKQLAFLDRHRSHALVGSWFRYIDAEGEPGRIGKRPTTAKNIRARLLFIGCYRNTTVMVRRSVLDKFQYRAEFPVCEDIDLWTRISLEHDGHNLPEVLTCYRRHPGGISRERRAQVAEMKHRIAAEQLERLGVAYRSLDLERHVALRRPKRLAATRETLDWARYWLEELGQSNKRRQVYPEPHFALAISERWQLLQRHLRRRAPELADAGDQRRFEAPRWARAAARLGLL